MTTGDPPNLRDAHRHGARDQAHPAVRAGAPALAVARGEASRHRAGEGRELPTGGTLAVVLPVAVLCAVATQAAVQAAMRRAEHPLSLAAANLVADPDEQRRLYALLRDQGTFHWFVWTELVDVLWALSLAVALVSITIAVGRGYPPGSRWRHLALASVPLAALVPAIDLVENACSLAMLADPDGFASWLAPAHAAVSRTKLAALAAVLCYFGVHVIALAVRGLCALRRRRRMWEPDGPCHHRRFRTGSSA